LAFYCQQCGECCSSMGEIIEIIDELDPFVFRIKLTVTNEERIVSVDTEKRNWFRLHDNKMSQPMACPFLWDTGNSKFVCSIHTSRPELCRQYSCFRILVFDSHDRKIGKVLHASRNFITADADLRRLWNQEIARVTILDEKSWEDHVEYTFSNAGYRIL
jgi:Fe-S-cluster containining protein